jgi:uncharacterized membrane protein HdeD (DUF308 family)
MMLVGLVGVAIGVLTFIKPALTTVALLYAIAIWAIFTGVLEIIAAVRLRKVVQGEWLLGIAGVLSVAFGVLAMMRPFAGVLAIVWLVGVYALIFGALELGLAFRLRDFGRRPLVTA